MILTFQPSKLKEEEKIKELDEYEERDSKDLKTIEGRIARLLGDLEKSEIYCQTLSYSVLWHRLFTEHNRGKDIENRILDPVTLLGDYCRLYEDKRLGLQDRLYYPLKFSLIFTSNAFSMLLPYLPCYFSKCNETFTNISELIEKGEALNKKEIFGRISKEVYKDQ